MQKEYSLIALGVVLLTVSSVKAVSLHSGQIVHVGEDKEDPTLFLVDHSEIHKYHSNKKTPVKSSAHGHISKASHGAKKDTNHAHDEYIDKNKVVETIVVKQVVPIYDKYHKVPLPKGMPGIGQFKSVSAPSKKKSHTYELSHIKKPGHGGKPMEHDEGHYAMDHFHHHDEKNHHEEGPHHDEPYGHLDHGPHGYNEPHHDEMEHHEEHHYHEDHKLHRDHDHELAKGHGKDFDNHGDYQHHHDEHEYGHGKGYEKKDDYKGDDHDSHGYGKDYEMGHYKMNDYKGDYEAYYKTHLSYGQLDHIELHQNKKFDDKSKAKTTDFYGHRLNDKFWETVATY